MKTALFCKSFSRDFPWLEYAKRSIHQFTTGFSEIVLVLPEGEWFDWPKARIIHVREHGDKYLNQQAIKMYADVLCDADYIAYHDSDCIFTEPVTPETFIKDGKPMWLHAPFREDEKRAWAPVISKWMNEPATESFMCRHDFCVPRDFLAEVRAYCVQVHKQELCDYIHAQHKEGQLLTFSEFNCMGAYAFKHCPERFTWLDKDDAPPAVVHQGFTHGGEERKAQDLAEFERILSQRLADMEFQPLVPALAKSVEIVQDVKYHVSALAKLASQSGLAKGRISLALKRAGLVKK